MKITPEISALLLWKKLDIFRNLRHVLIFWIYSGLNKINVIGNKRSARKSLFFQHFSRVFFHILPISRHFPMLNKTEVANKFLWPMELPVWTDLFLTWHRDYLPPLFSTTIIFWHHDSLKHLFWHFLLKAILD